MPEGDTILRSARSLRAFAAPSRVLGLRGSRAARFGRLLGLALLDVEARGKNLILHFEGDLAVLSHMGMTGSWHLYRRGERWRKPARFAHLVLDLDPGEIVCFTPARLELHSRDSLARHPVFQGLGPDVLAEAFDLDEVLRRLETRPRLPLGEFLLDQTLVSGIGNIYKSETLFAEGLDPFAPLESLDRGARAALLLRARALMSRNLSGPMRTTSRGPSGPRHAVYRRSGRPCIVCGAAILRRSQGEAARSTYFCPRCQRVEDRPPANS